jgi:exopolysaccharide biosynthesis polyprenyl glycosylphosphotransferase
MLANRQRGLINIYIFISSMLMVGLFYLYERGLPYVLSIELIPGIVMGPYRLAVFLGMVFSAGIVRNLGSQLHKLGLMSCLALSARQMFYVGAFVFALMFINKDRGLSRLYLGTYLCGGVAVLTLIHAVVPRLLAALVFPGNKKMSILLVGHSPVLNDWLLQRMHLGVEVAGGLSNTPWLEEELQKVRYLGPVSRLEEVIKTRKIDQVILAGFVEDPETTDRVIEICENFGCRFFVHNDYSSRYARKMISVEEDGEHFLSLQQEPLEDPINRVMKRGVDIMVSLPAVCLALPVLTIFVWAGQRLQAPGPVFFTHSRGGRNRSTFRMFKFRSMYVGNHDIVKQATTDDDRIYPLGGVLRRTSLDEFPQFINVLRGEMSVVGPRPHLPQHDEQFGKIARAYRTRSLIKPGITGLAQVKGYRGEITDTAKLHSRVYWDLYYVANWTVLLDLRIIYLTAWHVLIPPKTAY